MSGFVSWLVCVLGMACSGQMGALVCTRVDLSERELYGTIGLPPWPVTLTGRLRCTQGQPVLCPHSQTAGRQDSLR